MCRAFLFFSRGWIYGALTTKELLNDYPELEEEDITQALQYAAWLSSEKIKVLPVKGVAGA